MAASFSGRCLCGAVTYSCASEPVMSGFCHCEDCRRASGAGHSAHLLVAEAIVTITGEVKAYQSAADSGNIVERFFCPTCGAPVFSRNPKAMSGMIALRGSSLDDLEVFKPQMHVYAVRAASWDARDANLPAFEKMPPGM